uniref:Uncharacterized protein n=1 Tax=Timema bartmani TaxID=61472 RepID=A0A7R9F7Q3_9NEOP|nr:unnamed protein product [Timema bartmani]
MFHQHFRVWGAYIYWKCTCICIEGRWKTTFSTPDRDSKLNISVIGSLVYCESSVLDHAATEKGPRFCQGPTVYSALVDPASPDITSLQSTAHIAPTIIECWLIPLSLQSARTSPFKTLVLTPSRICKSSLRGVKLTSLLTRKVCPSQEHFPHKFDLDNVRFIGRITPIFFILPFKMRGGRTEGNGRLENIAIEGASRFEYIVEAPRRYTRPDTELFFLAGWTRVRLLRSVDLGAPLNRTGTTLESGVVTMGHTIICPVLLEPPQALDPVVLLLIDVVQPLAHLVFIHKILLDLPQALDPVVLLLIDVDGLDNKQSNFCDTWPEIVAQYILMAKTKFPEVVMHYDICASKVVEQMELLGIQPTTLLNLYMCSKHLVSLDKKNSIEDDIKAILPYTTKRTGTNWDSFFILNSLRTFVNLDAIIQDGRLAAIENVEKIWAKFYADPPFIVHLSVSASSNATKDSNYVKEILKSLSIYKNLPEDNIQNDILSIIPYVKTEINESSLLKVIEVSGNDYLDMGLTPLLVEMIISYDFSAIRKSKCSQNFPKTIVYMIFDPSITWHHIPNIHLYTKTSEHSGLKTPQEFVPDTLKSLSKSKQVPNEIKEEIQCAIPLLRVTNDDEINFVAMVALHKKDSDVSNTEVAIRENDVEDIIKEVSPNLREGRVEKRLKKHLRTPSWDSTPSLSVTDIQDKSRLMPLYTSVFERQLLYYGPPLGANYGDTEYLRCNRPKMDANYDRHASTIKFKTPRKCESRGRRAPILSEGMWVGGWKRAGGGKADPSSGRNRSFIKDFIDREANITTDNITGGRPYRFIFAYPLTATCVPFVWELLT